MGTQLDGYKKDVRVSGYSTAKRSRSAELNKSVTCELESSRYTVEHVNTNAESGLTFSHVVRFWAEAETKRDSVNEESMDGSGSTTESGDSGESRDSEDSTNGEEKDGSQSGRREVGFWFELTAARQTPDSSKTESNDVLTVLLYTDEKQLSAVIRMVKWTGLKWENERHMKTHMLPFIESFQAVVVFTAFHSPISRACSHQMVWS